MTPDEASKLVGNLKGAMPRITADQEDIVARNIATCDRDRVAAEIERYATSHQVFNLAEFLDTLPPRPTVGVGSVQRTARQIHADRQLKAQLEAQDAEAAALVASMTDEQLAVIKAEILAQMDENPKRSRGVPLLARSNSRTSPMFRRLILSHVKSTGAVPEGVPA